jgi:hypothetical protein
MKVFKVSLFFALLVAVCLPAVSQTQVRLDIPFDFTAAGKSLPAGHYTVAPAWPTDHGSWRIYNDHASVVVFTSWVKSPQTSHLPSLVFLQSGVGYSLVQIWPSEHSGLDVVRSKTKQTFVAESGKYVEIAAK